MTAAWPEVAYGLLAVRAGGAPVTARRRRRHGGRGDRKRGAGGAAHDGEGGGTHGRTRGSSKRWGRDGGQLGHGGRGRAWRHSARERGRASEGGVVTLGHLGVRIRRRREQGGAWRGGRTCGSNGARAAAWLPRRQFNEHVACFSVPDLGPVFWHIPCGFRTWLQ